MFYGKMKAVTFSYDDGITQDQCLIQILDKYNLKCTFNINSGRFGQSGMLLREGVSVAHCKPPKEELRAIYKGHEVAGHTVTHPNLSLLSDEDIIREVEEERLVLSDAIGYEVEGFDIHTLQHRHTGLTCSRI